MACDKSDFTRNKWLKSSHVGRIVIELDIQCSVIWYGRVNARMHLLRVDAFVFFFSLRSLRRRCRCFRAGGLDLRNVQYSFIYLFNEYYLRYHSLSPTQNVSRYDKVAFTSSNGTPFQLPCRHIVLPVTRYLFSVHRVRVVRIYAHTFAMKLQKHILLLVVCSTHQYSVQSHCETEKWSVTFVAEIVVVLVRTLWQSAS